MKNIITFILLFNFLINFAQEDTYILDPDVEISNGKKNRSWTFERYIGFNVYSKYENDVSVNLGWIPRYNFYAPKEEYSISFSLPIEFGGNLALSNTYIGLTANLPFTIDFNIGTNSTKYSTLPLGYFISAGLNNNYIFSAFHYYTFGNIIKTGFRFNINENIFGFYISYYHPYFLNTNFSLNEYGIDKLDINKLGTLSFGFIYNFETFKNLTKIGEKWSRPLINYNRSYSL